MFTHLMLYLASLGVTSEKVDIYRSIRAPSSIFPQNNLHSLSYIYLWFFSYGHNCYWQYTQKYVFKHFPLHCRRAKWAGLIRQIWEQIVPNKAAILNFCRSKLIFGVIKLFTCIFGWFCGSAAVLVFLTLVFTASLASSPVTDSLETTLMSWDIHTKYVHIGIYNKYKTFVYNL